MHRRHHQVSIMTALDMQNTIICQPYVAGSSHTASEGGFRQSAIPVKIANQVHIKGQIASAQRAQFGTTMPAKPRSTQEWSWSKTD